MESLVYTVSLVLLFGSLAEGGECPKNPTKAFQECASKININLNTAQGHKFVTDAEYSKKMCKGEELNNAIACMETIYNDCKSNEIDKNLMVHPSSWRDAVKEVCDNIDFITENKDCFIKSTKETTKCVEEVSSKAQADINLKDIDVATSTKGDKNEKEKFELICGLSKKLMDCFDNSLLKHCPKRLEEIIDRIFYKFLPPICHPGKDNSKVSYVNVKDEDPDNGAVRMSGIATLSVAVAMCLRSML